MQTKKFLFVIGLGAMFVASALTSGARDTEEQIKAREALRQKMSELDGSPATPPAPPPAPAKPAKSAPPAPPVAAPAVTIPSASQFGPIPEAVEDANASRMREALRQQMAILEFAPVPDAIEDANASLMREALRRQMAVLQSTPAVATKPTKSGRASGYTAPLMSAPLVMEAPLPPISGVKAARLAELLQRYNADLITPKEYHTQRAAILAEP